MCYVSPENHQMTLSMEMLHEILPATKQKQKKQNTTKPQKTPNNNKEKSERNLLLRVVADHLESWWDFPLLLMANSKRYFYELNHCSNEIRCQNRRDQVMLNHQQQGGTIILRMARLK